MWLYPEEFNPENFQGFVYKITNLETGQYYIGKKFFWKLIKRPPLKGKKRRRIEKVESDWKLYWSSCNELAEDLKVLGEDKFKREILLLCESKWQCAYQEARLQFEHKVLEDPTSYNGIINIRLRKFLKKEDNGED